MIKWLLAALSAQFQYDEALLDALEHVESRGNWAAVSPSGCIGTFQVCPQWSPVPAPLLYVPVVNRLEAARQLRYWQRRSKGDLRRALQGYYCGNAGLRNQCGQDYSRRVLRLVKD